MDEESKKTNNTSDDSVKKPENEVKETSKVEEKKETKSEETVEAKNNEAKTEEPKVEEPKAEEKNTEVKEEASKPEVNTSEIKQENTKKSKKEKAEKPKKKKKIGLIVSIVFIILAIIAGAVGGAVYAILFQKTEIDLSKYVTIEFEGYEGYASFDETNLVIDEKGLKKVLEDKKLASKLASRIENKAEVKENEKLKNGDQIEVKVKISEDWLKENKIKLTSDTFKITVKNLEEPNSIDLFEDLELSYSGISPNLTVTLKNNSDDNFVKNKVSFSMEDKADKDNSSSYSLYDMANGDKITVTATYSQSDLENAGYVVKEDEKEFTIEGQAEYVKKAEQITSEIKETMSKKALDRAKTTANSLDYDVANAYKTDFSDANYYDYKFTHADPVLQTIYMATFNDDDLGYSDSRNIFYFVYKVTFTDTNTSKTYDYFVVTSVKDIVVDEEGLYTGRTYNYDKYSNYSFEVNGEPYSKTADGVSQAIKDTLEDDYTITEIK